MSLSKWRGPTPHMSPLQKPGENPASPGEYLCNEIALARLRCRASHEACRPSVHRSLATAVPGPQTWRAWASKRLFTTSGPQTAGFPRRHSAVAGLVAVAAPGCVVLARGGLVLSLEMWRESLALVLGKASSVRSCSQTLTTE